MIGWNYNSWRNSLFGGAGILACPDDARKTCSLSKSARPGRNARHSQISGRQECLPHQFTNVPYLWFQRRQKCPPHLAQARSLTSNVTPITIASLLLSLL